MVASGDVPNKVSLLNTTLHVSEVCSTSEESEHTLTWIINRCHKRRSNTCYWKKCDETDWTITMMEEHRKGEKICTVEIDTSSSPYNGKITCLVDENAYSKPIDVNMIREGVYNAKVKRSLIHPTPDRFLQSENLELLFKFRTIRNLCDSHFLGTERNGALEDVFKTLWGFRCYADFTIRLKDTFFLTHKSLLAVRSKFFRQYIEENCKDGKPGYIDLDKAYESMYTILCYIYSGQLLIQPKNLHQVLLLSKKLQIQSVSSAIETCCVFSFLEIFILFNLPLRACFDFSA